jgi:hypothetical protein
LVSQNLYVFVSAPSLFYQVYQEINYTFSFPITQVHQEIYHIISVRVFRCREEKAWVHRMRQRGKGFPAFAASASALASILASALASILVEVQRQPSAASERPRRLVPLRSKKCAAGMAKKQCLKK